MVTNDKMTVVFICSEGSVMPLLNKNSAKKRVTQILEVLDICER